MLKLRLGVVVDAGPETDGFQRLAVEVAAQQRQALADTKLVGRCAVGDEVVVNTEAQDLGLGSGGFDLVHVNLTRGLDGEGLPGAHVMKLNYTSLQHAVIPVEGEGLKVPLNAPVGVFGLHGQLAPVAWAFGQATGSKGRMGYIQTTGGALSGGFSMVVGQLRQLDLLAGHLTAGQAFGGEGEAITTIGAIHHAIVDLGWDVALCGPGPGILGSASTLGHGGMIALDSVHAALSLGAPTLLVARMSSGDPRPRHHGLSHHTQSVLDLALAPVTVALAQGFEATLPDRHSKEVVTVDLAGYEASGLPATTMGRTIVEDPAFFSAALAAGVVLGDLATSGQ